MFNSKISIPIRIVKRFYSTMKLKLSANLSFMYQEHKSLLDRYAKAKNSGFTAVECAFPYDYSIEEVKKAKEDAEVEQVLINVYPGDLKAGDLGFAALPDKQEEFRNSISKAISYAKALQCNKIHIMSGKVETPTPKHDEIYKTNLRFAVGLFEKENITGVIEPINPYSVPNYYMNSFCKAIDIIKEINSPNLKLQLDLFHLQLLKGNLTNNIKSFLPYAAHIQIAQAPDRHEPDTAGEINYPYVFKLLKELNYSEWIGLEYIPAGKSDIGLKWITKEDFEFYHE